MLVLALVLEVVVERAWFWLTFACGGVKYVPLGGVDRLSRIRGVEWGEKSAACGEEDSVLGSTLR